jgi:hypothetical protein
VTIDEKMRGRDEDYATRYPIRHFDLPAVLTATVSTAHLYATNNLNYEACLPKRFVDNIKSTANVRELDIKKHFGLRIPGQMPALSNEQIDSCYDPKSEDADIREVNRTIKDLMNQLLEAPSVISGLSVRYQVQKSGR